MLLISLTIRNFACFEDMTFPRLGRLAVFIGENDAGKTNVLNAVDDLLAVRNMSDEHFRRLPDGTNAGEVTIEATFTLEDSDTLPADYRCGVDGALFKITKVANEGEHSLIIRGQGYSDDRFDHFAGRDNQMQLLREYDLTPAGTEAVRLEQLGELVTDGKLTRIERDLEADWATIRPHLPSVVRISSTDYETPEAMIQQNLVRVGRSVLEPSLNAAGNPQELPALRRLRKEIKDRMDDELQKAVKTLKNLHPKLRSVTVEPSIDFSRAVTAPHLNVDLGEGQQLLDGFGEGTKRRLWMGLLEWEQEITKGTSQSSVLRLYDEPDDKLHYAAQRRLFENISDLASDEKLHTQCFVATHSVTLIDRAPLADINLLAIEDDYRRSTSRLETPGDATIPQFFTEIGASVGLSNVVLLYERGFLVVEGESEDEFIRSVYSKIYQRSPLEEGIVVVNLHGCGAWKSVLDVLLNNRSAMSHFLLDADCQTPGSSGYMTVEYLKEVSLGPTFIQDQVTYVGTKELEDSFSDDVISRALINEFPLEDGSEWQPEDVAALRTADKFSDELRHAILTRSTPAVRNNAKKPAIAAAIGRAIQTTDEIPERIRHAFADVRSRAGLETPTAEPATVAPPAEQPPASNQ